MWIWQGLYLGWIVHIACSRTFSQKNNKSIEKLHRVCLWGYGRTFKALLVVICKGRYGPPERSCRRNRARFFDFPHQRKTWALLGMCRFPFELPWISWMTDSPQKLYDLGSSIQFGECRYTYILICIPPAPISIYPQSYMKYARGIYHFHKLQGGRMRLCEVLRSPPRTQSGG